MNSSREVESHLPDSTDAKEKCRPDFKWALIRLSKFNPISIQEPSLLWRSLFMSLYLSPASRNLPPRTSLLSPSGVEKLERDGRGFSKRHWSGERVPIERESIEQASLTTQVGKDDASHVINIFIYLSNFFFQRILWPGPCGQSCRALMQLDGFLKPLEKRSKIHRIGCNFVLMRRVHWQFVSPNSLVICLFQILLANLISFPQEFCFPWCK